MTESRHKHAVLSRRKFLILAGASAALGSAYYYGIHRQFFSGFLLKHSRQMMGTIVNFTIIGDDEESCSQALQETIQHMEEIGFAINWYNPDSPLSKLNREGILRNPDPVLVKVTKMALEMSEITEGAFDPTVLPLLSLYKGVKTSGKLPPEDQLNTALSLVDFHKVTVSSDIIRYTSPGMGMTLDGIGKGFVVDEGVRKINALGFANVCIEAGGDLMVTGTKKSGAPWTIGIRNPRPSEGGKQFIIKMKNRAIATSGDYMQSFTTDRKYHHIINPATGFSPPELASCSILAPSVAKADGLATSAMVLGPEKSLALLDSLPECEGFLIGKDLTTYNSKDFFS